MFYTYIDESGSDTWPSGKAARKYALFIEAAIIVSDRSREPLISQYTSLLDKEYGHGFTIRELFKVYERVTGRKGELKGGYIGF